MEFSFIIVYFQVRRIIVRSYTRDFTTIYAMLNVSKIIFCIILGCVQCLIYTGFHELKFSSRILLSI